MIGFKKRGTKLLTALRPTCPGVALRMRGEDASERDWQICGPAAGVYSEH